MTIRNPNWYNSHVSRRYPLDDNATGTGDDGTRLKDDIIVDVHLRWPRTAGEYAYLAGVTVTPTIVTAVIMAADSPTATGTPVPLAAVTVPQPVLRHWYYNVEPLYPGAFGFIAFGDPSEPFAIRFSTPAQGLLTPKNARAFDKLPVPSMQKFGRADSLTGLVKILGGRDIEVVKENVIYDDVEQAALVIRLTNPTIQDNVFREYAGPCSARPESRSCRKEGVETINGVGPDCNGNIEIEFLNFTVGPYDNCGSEQAGTTLDQDVGITEVCALPRPSPDAFRGRDLCLPEDSSESETSAGFSSVSLSSESLASEDSLSSEVQICKTLPFIERFNNVLQPGWDLKIGKYGFDTTDSPGQPPEIGMCAALVPVEYFQYVSLSGASILSLSSMSESLSSFACDVTEEAALLLQDASRRQVLTWDDCAIATSLDKRVVSHIQLTNQAARINGGLVINYRLLAPFTNPRFEYFFLSLNRNSNQIELLRFNGSTFILENGVTPPAAFTLTDWYQLTVTTAALGGGLVGITCQVSNVTNPGWGTVTFTVPTSQYGDGVGGFHGIGNNMAVTRFSYWMIEDA